MNNETACRSCGGKNITTFLDLGKTPLADRLVNMEQLGGEEPRFPLQVAFCNDCSLAQILETVPPEQLFGDDYPYFSSFSPALLAHSKSNVEDLIDRRSLSSDSLVMELASNDGYLLQYYQERGIPVLGIDPASGPAKAAIEKGVPTMIAFFTKDLAQHLRSEGKAADVIHANNVLAHVADTNGFVAGISTLLKEDSGVAVIEVPYVRELIDRCEFDTIYHEHLCYFSVTAVEKLFARHGLFLNDLKRLSIHGGSLRLFASRQPGKSSIVEQHLEEEQRLGIDTAQYYTNFASRVDQIRSEVIGLLSELRSEGKSIAAYGAAAKGATLINYMGIGPELVDFVVDRNTYKHGKYMPGMHIPIRAPEHLLHRQPDYVLTLAWNFIDEIMEQQADYLQRGGRFIVPIPQPSIIPAAVRSSEGSPAVQNQPA